MQYDRLTTGLAVVLGILTVVLTVVAFLSNLAVLFLALTFGLSTYLVYYHASGRMANRVYERVERQARVDGGGRRRRTGAGPREEWRPPREGATAREAAFGRGGSRAGSQRARRGRRRRSAGNGPGVAQAYRTLGLDPGADQASVRSAYREKVKEVHPDTDGGDEQAFKEIKEAYETLTDSSN